MYKAISLWEPWASLIAMGLKQYETRSWGTSYRGELLICAAKRKTYDQESAWHYLRNEYFADSERNFRDLPFGCAVVLVTLTDCVKMTPQFINQQSECERDCGDWQVNRYAWKLENIRLIENVPIKGAQGLFNVDTELRFKN